MAGKDDLKELIDGRQKYREDVLAGNFGAYGGFVTEHKYEEMLKGIQDPRNHFQVASVQQGLDLMAASERAVDIRNMKPADYRRAYSESHQGQSAYENSKLDRFSKGMI